MINYRLFSRQLKVLRACFCLLFGVVINPSIADFENHAPEAEQSLFDTLFLDHSVNPPEYAIPYPFSRLLDRLNVELGQSVNGDGNKASVVWIPLGRCIDRDFGKADYFSFPRVVVATDSEHFGETNLSRQYLKDRLFLGYQAKSQTIQVISYNEFAARFEFQQVNDYGPDSTVEVMYAPREQCIACHQNQGPIFSQAPWQETDNNPDLYERLSEALGESFSKAGFRRSNASNIDSSTNRANLFSLYQQFWQSSCNTPDQSVARQCRAGLFEMVLVNRFQERNRGFSMSPRIEQYVLPFALSGIEQDWPNGISVPSSDIEDYNPVLDGALVSRQDASLVRDFQREAAEKLKQPRSMMISWQTDDLFRVVEGLGRLLPLASLRRLDARLYQ